MTYLCIEIMYVMNSIKKMKTTFTFVAMVIFCLLLVSAARICIPGNNYAVSSRPVEIEVFTQSKDCPKTENDRFGESPGKMVPESFQDDPLTFELWMTELDQWNLKNN